MSHEEENKQTPAAERPRRLRPRPRPLSRETPKAEKPEAKARG